MDGSRHDQGMSSLKVLGTSTLQEAVNHARSYKAATSLLFFNETLSLDVIDAENVIAAVPVRKLNQGNQGWAAAVAIFDTCNRFNHYSPLNEGLGRWHRPVAAKSEPVIEWPQFAGPLLLASPNMPGMAQYAKNHVRNSGTQVLALKSFPISEALDSRIHLFQIPSSLSLTTQVMKFKPLTNVLRITQHCQNVISQLDANGFLPDFSFTSPSLLYIRTMSGRMAQIIAGDPAKGLVALSPMDFRFASDDDLLIQIGVREADPMPDYSLEPRLIITSADSSGVVSGELSSSLIVNVEASNFFHASPNLTRDGAILSFAQLSIKKD